MTEEYSKEFDEAMNVAKYLHAKLCKLGDKCAFPENVLECVDDLGCCIDSMILALSNPDGDYETEDDYDTEDESSSDEDIEVPEQERPKQPLKKK